MHNNKQTTQAWNSVIINGEGFSQTSHYHPLAARQATLRPIKTTAWAAPVPYKHVAFLSEPGRVVRAVLCTEPADCFYYAQKLPSEAKRAFLSNKSDSSCAPRVAAVSGRAWKHVSSPGGTDSLQGYRDSPSTAGSSLLWSTLASNDSRLSSPGLRESSRHKSPVPGHRAPPHLALAQDPNMLLLLLLTMR